MDLEARKNLGIPLVADFEHEACDELQLGLDDLEEYAKVTQARGECRVPDRDDPDVPTRVRVSPVLDDLVVLRLEAIENGLDLIVRRVGEKVATRVD